MSRPDGELNELYVYECRGSRYPRKEPPFEGFLGIWPEPPFYYVFSDRQAIEPVRLWINGLEGWSLGDTYRMDYEQWQQVSSVRHRVGPFVIGAPGSGKVDAAAPEEIFIGIDPGVVFGSGLHATTRGCLLSVANLLRDFPIRNVVDLGTGTGILALACALLGVRRVVAMDCNLLAVQVARRNVELNRREDNVLLLAAQSLEVLKSPSDLLIMNLEWPCLKEIIKGEDWMKYRRIIISGFLESQWDELRTLLPPGIHILHQENLEDWITLVISPHDASTPSP